MIKTITTIQKATTIVLTMLVVFSCQNDFKDVQKVGVLQNQPIGEAENIDLKYTEFENDSVRIIANLISSKMLDYTNRNFGFSEFPNGIELKLFDENNNKTSVFSDYAVYFTETDVIDLRGNVIIATHEGDTLFTEQLFYNEKLEWVFTNEPWQFNRTVGPLHGIGFDSDKDFKNFQMLQMGGDIEIDN